MNSNLYVDIHVIQTVPPSCVNRDDTGSPKTAFYGGTMRARVSSQAWKRAVRHEFANVFPAQKLGIRTRNTVHLISDEICKQLEGIEPERAIELAEIILTAGGAKGEGKDVLFFISRAQIEALAAVAVELEQSGSAPKKGSDIKDKEFKKKASAALIENPGIDMVLFGRMAASNAALNYDAACQVAHAISTHTVSNEFDYFSAVDDNPLDEESAGAGHLGTVEFNSSTLYRYATINVKGLEKYIDDDDIPGIISAFAEAFILSMPTGKQNTFANRTVPDMVYVTIRTDQPVNLTGAFEKPVYSGNNGYVEQSEARLEKYASEVYSSFVAPPRSSYIVGKTSSELAETLSLTEMLEKLKASISAELSR